LLTLALPEAPERAWIADFADGLRVAQQAFGCNLIGGDDYELLIAVPPENAEKLLASAEKTGIDVHDVGVLEAKIPVVAIDSTGKPMEPRRPGYDHFSR
jgi:thiamine monophosphate kinase